MDEAASSRTTKIERASAEPAPACILVIFGATGDLTHRLLAPALYNLARWKLLPEDFAIVAVGRTGQGLRRVPERPHGRGHQVHTIQERCVRVGTVRRCCLEPRRQSSRLSQGRPRRSSNVQGSRRPDRRKSNWAGRPGRRPLLSRDCPRIVRDHRPKSRRVRTAVAETVGVEKRGRFYERIGALRDMVPNHLFQLFTLTAMEPPSSFGADAVRNRKQDVLTATRALSHDEVLAATVRAQYVSGTIHGEARRAYRDEPDVDPSSATETFAALRLSVDNWRWAGVPFSSGPAKPCRAAKRKSRSASNRRRCRCSGERP